MPVMTRKLLFLLIFGICTFFFLATNISLPASPIDHYQPNNEGHSKQPPENIILNPGNDQVGAGNNTQESENETIPSKDAIAVLVIACNRPTVTRCLDSLLKYQPSSVKFPIIVSQDCGDHLETSTAIDSYLDRITHIRQPDLSEIIVPPVHRNFLGYYKISRHYGWALKFIFDVLNYQNVIIVEDDLEVAPDFFEYFAAVLPLLRKDPSLWCASAWNDNGKEKRINMSAPELLHRSDFFPGLGWMLTKNLWEELRDKWPKGFWDDWMREPDQRKGRACIRPEISRTRTFGAKGVSLGTFYETHLRFIKLNQQFVPFTALDLTYLYKEVFDTQLVRSIHLSKTVNSVDELRSEIKNGETSRSMLKMLANNNYQGNASTEYNLLYKYNSEFAAMAKQLDIMDDFKAGVPRTGYLGVVSFMFRRSRVYLAPVAMKANVSQDS